MALTVKPDSLKSIDEPDTCRQLPQNHQTDWRLRDYMGYWTAVLTQFWRSLGRQTYLVRRGKKCVLFRSVLSGISRKN